MRKITLIFIISFITLQLFAQKDKVLKEHKGKGKHPPGTIWLRDSIYIDQIEVRNLDYREFLERTEKKEPEKLESIRPDQTVWYPENMAFELYYLKGITHRDYPVVGVTYEQAVAFCKWRTDLVKEYVKVKNTTIEKMFGARDFYYRLPTKEEWEYAASAGLSSDFSYGFESIINKDNFPNVNVAETKALYAREIYDPVDPVYYRYPNRYNLYGMIGNVAEMVLEKGIAKGGSFDHPLAECAIRKSQEYTQPMRWLGFRCVCVLVK